MYVGKLRPNENKWISPKNMFHPTFLYGQIMKLDEYKELKQNILYLQKKEKNKNWYLIYIRLLTNFEYLTYRNKIIPEYNLQQLYIKMFGYPVLYESDMHLFFKMVNLKRYSVLSYTIDKGILESIMNSYIYFKKYKTYVSKCNGNKYTYENIIPMLPFFKILMIDCNHPNYLLGTHAIKLLSEYCNHFKKIICIYAYDDMYDDIQNMIQSRSNFLCKSEEQYAWTGVPIDCKLYNIVVFTRSKIIN